MAAINSAVQEPLEFEQISEYRRNRVLQAVSNPAWDFRTIPGIAKETSLSEDEIRKVLNSNPDLFRKSPVPDRMGRPLYTLRSRQMRRNEKRAMLRMFLTKSIT